MYWHGMIEGTFCQDQGRAHFRVRRFIPTWRGRSRALPMWRGRSRALPTWRGRSRALPSCPWVSDFPQKGGVGEVGCSQWVKSRDEVTPEWIEDDDDFRVVLRRPVDWNEGTLGSDGVISRTTQETTLQTNQETVKKSRDRNGGKSRDRNGGKSRDRSITRTLDYKGESDNRQNVGEAKSRDRNVTKSRDRRDVRTTQETTQQTTQDYPKKRHGKNGEKRSDKSKHIIVALVKRFPKIRQTEMAKATGLTVKGVEKVLAQLKAANVIVRVGGKRFGQWQICKQESNA